MFSLTEDIPEPVFLILDSTYSFVLGPYPAW